MLPHSPEPTNEEFYKMLEEFSEDHLQLKFDKKYINLLASSLKTKERSMIYNSILD